MSYFNSSNISEGFLLAFTFSNAREYLDKALERGVTIDQVAPTLFKEAGPKCLQGPCPEGKMTCGNPKGVKNE